jgi:NADPH-dependent curcumin reductase CurA
MSRTNQQWLLTSRPHGEPSQDNFTWRESPVPPLNDGEILVRVVYLSLDPTNRGWMNETATYLPPIPLGNVMRGGALGVVEESRNASFAPGDMVQGLLGWQLYAVSNGAGLSKLPPLPIPLTAHLGLLGHIGLTAYYGLLDVGKPKAGETLVVSAAAGAVGSLVAQIGKIKDLRVVGIAGGPAKCRWLTEELGVDAAIDYRSEDVPAKLREQCPKGIDIYFDNVGGKILEAALAHIRLGARIPLCGMISQYNNARPEPGPSNLVNLIVQRALIQGFLVSDYMSRAEPALRELIGWHMQGRLKFRVEIDDGLPNAPNSLRKLFTGANTGKLAVRVSPEPA